MLNQIWEFLLQVWEKLYGIQLWLCKQILNLCCEVVYFLLKVCFTAVLTIINGIDFAGVQILDAFNSWDLLPDQVIYILDQLSFGMCLTMLASAYGIRLLLNLIPAAFTRV